MRLFIREFILYLLSIPNHKIAPEQNDIALLIFFLIDQFKKDLKISIIFEIVRLALVVFGLTILFGGNNLKIKVKVIDLIIIVLIIIVLIIIALIIIVLIIIAVTITEHTGKQILNNNIQPKIPSNLLFKTLRHGLIDLLPKLPLTPINIIRNNPIGSESVLSIFGVLFADQQVELDYFLPLFAAEEVGTDFGEDYKAAAFC
jgi:hypothetical protein